MSLQFVRTVLGDVDPAALGHTQTHEHLLIDLSRPLSTGTTVSERRRDEEPISLANYYSYRRNHPRDDLRLLDEDDAVDALNEYKAAGGGSVVEATPIGLGRDSEGLARISRATGVHIIMGSAFYYRDFHPTWLDAMAQSEIADLIAQDITAGVGGTGLRSGVIGEVGLGWPHHPVEERVLRAASAAQAETGAPLLIHPGRHPESPFEALKLIENAGGDVERVIMSHVDRTLFGHNAIRKLAATGCYVEFDLFGQESSYYAPAPIIDMPNDATRVDCIRDLMEQGFTDRVLIAQDICHKSHMRKYGGEGYTHIIENVIPLMRRKGMSEEQIHAVSVANPAKALSFRS